MERSEVACTTNELVSSALGSATGAAIGVAIAGPAGAVGGAVVGTAVEHVTNKIGKEIRDRILSKSEERKVDAVFTEATDLIKKKIEQGCSPRQDGFFNAGENDRSPAEEVFEGVVFAAQRECEEKKEHYFARLYANLAFDKTISRPMANKLIKLAEGLTYRQLLILTTVGVNQSLGDGGVFKKTAYSHVEGLSAVTVASEVFELYRMSLLGSSDAILDCAGINPSKIRIVGYGALLFNLMELGQPVQEDDTNDLLAEIFAFMTGSNELLNPPEDPLQKVRDGE